MPRSRNPSAPRRPNNIKAAASLPAVSRAHPVADNFGIRTLVDEGGKWTIRSSLSVRQDRWIDLRADDCTTASGADISPYYVLNYPDWVHIVALTADDGLVLVRQYRHAAGECVLELPAGAVDAADFDETAAAQRELAEETGYVAAHWEKVGALYVNAATHTNRVHTFLARDATPAGPQLLEAGEQGMTVHVMPIAHVLAQLRNGLMGQAMQVSGVLLALAAAGRLDLSGR
jgi:8-oxo-dGTP pyrophosphatase MutT (NUDIX family)